MWYVCGINFQLNPKQVIDCCCFCCLSMRLQLDNENTHKFYGTWKYSNNKNNISDTHGINKIIRLYHAFLFQINNFLVETIHEFSK